ncbi:type II toxin-antitoxin system HicA family toxin [Tautonia rosea]|uniref:type II toxin-antitoxin system HicA family toxin n=1 Tax=Tautonia rosea TaxID=2728037 RepID=UPI0014740059|nr:type II toxin-antitoxin system HicA family toxin [Tautonia rosea]
MAWKKTLVRVLRGTADSSIRFDEVRLLLEHPGFEERIRGGHHIFTREGIEEILNLQPRGALAKAYQIKQVRDVIVQYQLAGNDDEHKFTL